MGKVRILQIIDNINIDAGVSSVVMNIYRNIDRTKYQFDFFVSHKGYQRGKTYEKEILDLGGTITYFGAPLSKNFFQANRKAKKFMKENAKKYDAIHLHTPTIAEFTLKYAKRYGAKSIITHSHSAMTSTNPVKAVINGILLRRMLKYSNNYWACSEKAARFIFGDKLFNSGKVEIIKNAIAPEKYKFDSDVRDEERKHNNFEDKIVCLHVSNFTTIKNLNFMLPIIRKASSINRNLIFLFVGNGGTRESLIKQSQEMGLENICLFPGTSDEVEKYLQMSDVFFMPSIAEGFGMAAVEAQASGLECILSDGVPKEVEVGKVDFISLQDCSKWISKILEVQINDNNERRKRSDDFINSELNISNSILHIQDLYRNLKKW